MRRIQLEKKNHPVDEKEKPPVDEKKIHPVDETGSLKRVEQFEKAQSID